MSDVEKAKWKKKATAGAAASSAEVADGGDTDEQDASE